MKKLGIMLLAVALIFAGFYAFGSVSQTVSTEGLTVTTLMLPTTEKTVEAAQGGLYADFVGYAEEAIATNVWMIVTTATEGLHYTDAGLLNVSDAQGKYRPGRHTERLQYLKYPMLEPH